MRVQVTWFELSSYQTAPNVSEIKGLQLLFATENSSSSQISLVCLHSMCLVAYHLEDKVQ
jgi:hypothetical protein